MPPTAGARPSLGSLPGLDHVSPLETLETVTEDVALRLWDTEREVSVCAQHKPKGLWPLPEIQPGLGPCRLALSKGPQLVSCTRGSAWPEVMG